MSTYYVLGIDLALEILHKIRVGGKLLLLEPTISKGRQATNKQE